MSDLFEVKVNINGKPTTVKIEKGISFSNKGGTYTVGENGSIMMNGQKVDSIKMTNYQFGVFKAVADMDNANHTNEIILSAKDFEEANKKGVNLNKALAKFLPQGYRIERENPTDSSLSLYATNGKESQSAELKFFTQPKAKPLTGADADLVKEYEIKFKDMAAKDIAFAMHEQISGPSRYAKTLAMFDAIPDDKLAETIRKYNSIGYFHNTLHTILSDDEDINHNPIDTSRDFTKKYDTLFYSMNNELGIGYNELKPRIERTLIAIGDGHSPKDASNIKTLLAKASTNEEFDKDTMCQIENSFAAILGRRPEYEKGGILGTKFMPNSTWHRVDKTDPYGEMTYNRQRVY